MYHKIEAKEKEGDLSFSHPLETNISHFAYFHPRCLLDPSVFLAGPFNLVVRYKRVLLTKENMYFLTY